MCEGFCGQWDQCNFLTEKCHFWTPEKGAVAKNYTAIRVIRDHLKDLLSHDSSLVVEVSTFGSDYYAHKGYSYTDYCLRVIYSHSLPQPHPELFENAYVLYGKRWNNDRTMTIRLVVIICVVAVAIKVAFIMCAIRIRRKRLAQRQMIELAPPYNMQYSELPQAPVYPQFYVVVPSPFVPVDHVAPATEKM